MTVKTYALMVENEIFQLVVMPEEHPDSHLWEIGFANNPFGMDITPYSKVQIGWVWNGSKFVDPKEIE